MLNRFKIEKGKVGEKEKLVKENRENIYKK